jgi:hypothetical protein
MLAPWSSAPVAYSPIRPKSQFFNIGHDYALWIRNFMVMMKKLDPMAHGHNPVKVDLSILSIANFMLMINYHFALFQLLGNFLKIKKCVTKLGR